MLRISSNNGTYGAHEKKQISAKTASVKKSNVLVYESHSAHAAEVTSRKLAYI